MRQTFILLTGLLLYSLVTNGQEKSIYTNSVWRVGVNTMPGIAFEEFMSGSDTDFTNTIGIRVEKSISTHFAVITGLNYYNLELSSGGYFGAPCGSPRSTCFWYTDRTYLEIPLVFKIYYLKEKRRINPYLTIGTFTTFSTKEKNRRRDNVEGMDLPDYFYEDNRLKYQQNYLTVSFGTEFTLSKQIGFYLEPNFRYSFLSKSEIVSFNPKAIMGLIVGINYEF